MSEEKIAEIAPMLEEGANNNNSAEYQEYFSYVCNEMAFSQPKNWREAFALFNYLKKIGDQ